MGYYSDPTASQAIGNIDREFSRYEKRAKKLVELFEEGKISLSELEKASLQFRGLYKHVLSNAFQKRDD